jgi:hypothetical protein
MKTKWLIIGIMLLVIESSILPNIQGNIEKNTNEALQSNTGNPTNITLSDWIGDVCSYTYLLNKWKIISNSTDIEVVNLDLTKATYAQQGAQATLSLQVAGRIEDRGHIEYENITNDTIDLVEYSFQLTTSEQNYTISYTNQTGVLFYDDVQINLTSSDFTVVNNILSITFSLMSPDETYEDLQVVSIFAKANLSSQPPEIVFLSDTLPNIWEKALLFGRFTINNAKGDFMMLEATSLWMVRFHPFQLIHYKAGEMILISTPYKARIITNHFLFGVFDILEL